MASDTGVLRGTQVDLTCAITPGTPDPGPGHDPIVVYDASLTVNTMRGAVLSDAQSTAIKIAV